MRFTHPRVSRRVSARRAGSHHAPAAPVSPGLSPQRSARDRSRAARAALSFPADQHPRALPHDRILSTRRHHLHAFSARRIVRRLAAQRPAARSAVHRRHRFRSALHVAARRAPICYCVPTEEARARLIQDGIDPAIVEVTGIPDRARVCRPARSIRCGPPAESRSRSSGGVDHGRRPGRGRDGSCRPIVAGASAGRADRLHHRQQSRAAPPIESHVENLDRARLRQQHARLAGGRRCGDQQSGRTGRIGIVGRGCADHHSVCIDRPRSA